MASIFDILFNRKSKKPDFTNVGSRTTQSGSGGGGGIKPDFSRVDGTVRTGGAPGPDFRNVNSSVTSTEAPIGGGGGGSTGTQNYTVVSGDTLSHIAKRFYGKASRWPAIFEANRDKLSDPDKIFPGQVLRIPADDGSDD